MTAQPVGSTPPPPSPAAAAQLRARIAGITDQARADRWLPWFDLEWSQALEGARQSLDLGRVYDTLATWQRRLDTAPVVDAFLAGGCDTSDGVALEDVIGPRR
ncbi:DUF6247 family protein [Streptomyces sp. H39-C1]|uniref:DUF6247 family protein n=1 Tax=Streptomyces sp. H39-C1 TaxID=3004355 RepID=UPI0022B027E3|nr:DUF6247 family protein [Streptomyces sp. H39-C1]MCZ4102642.1 DUF6247 family protein [Streptomyces sp. H39-C1]